MIELTPLRYFTASFELGTISAAAAAHGISQPSLSQALQKLEDTLGAPLFLRTRKGLKPTAEGRDLYRHAQSILGAVEKAETRFRHKGPIRASLYTSPDILLDPFQGSLLALRRTYPALELRFEAEAGAAELALVDRSCSPAGHRFHELFREPYVFAVAKRHPMAALPEVTLQDILAVPMIARRYCPSYEALLRTLALENLSFPICAEAVHDRQVLELVRLGLGAALVPAGHVRSEEQITGVPLRHTAPFDRQIGLAIKKTAFADELFHTWMKGWTPVPR
ncbi:LysR family transcriptional regulator [Roseibium sp.]|uniref:LysR family transcriptional regulator n=1 Tax=Roseibium sp. TaxID=1936156 RepID=UPI003D0A6889